MSTNVISPIFPAILDQKLRQVRRRHWVYSLLRGTLSALAALIAGMMLAMLCDWWLTPESIAVRAMMTSLVLLAAVAIGTVMIVRELRAFAQLKRAARDVDAVVPQLEERWSTVASFAESQQLPADPVTQAMLHQVTHEAVAMSRLVQPRQVVRPVQLRRPLQLSGLMTCLFVAFLMMNWPQNRVLLARFWSPASLLSATRLHNVTGDLTVPRGDSVVLSASVSGLPRQRATLTLKRSDQEIEEIVLNLDPEQAASIEYSIASLEQSFAYRIQAGDGRSEWYTVTAVDRPAFSEVQLTVRAPDYVDRPEYSKDYLPDRVRAIEGSRLTIAMRANGDLTQFQMIKKHSAEESPQEVIRLEPDEDGWYRFETLLTQDVALTPYMVNEHDLKNDDQHACRIRVLEDRAPVARILSPTDDVAVDPDETIEIEFEAHDDYGVAKAELVVYEEPEEEGTEPAVLDIMEIDLGDQHLAEHVLASTSLDLSQYALEEGRQVSYSIRVTDNRMLGLHERGDTDRSENMLASRAASETERGRSTPAESGEPGVSENQSTEEAQVSNGSRNSSQATAVADSNSPAENSAESAMAENTSADSRNSPTRQSAPANDGVASLGPEDAQDTTEGAGTNQSQLQTAAVESASRVSAEDAAQSPPAQTAATTAKSTAADSSDSNSAAPTTDSDPDAKPALAQAGPTDPSAAGSQDSPSEPPTDAGNPSDADQAASDQPPISGNENSPLANAAKQPPGTSSEETPASQSETAESPMNAPSSRVAQAEIDQSHLADSRTASATSGNPANAPTSSASPNANASSRNDPSDQPMLASRDDRQETPQERNAPSQVPWDVEVFDKRAGQNSESRRRRVRIEKRLASAPEPEDAPQEEEKVELREQLVAIDHELEPAEVILQGLVDNVERVGIADPQIQDLQEVDQRLSSVDEMIATLREESKDTPYAFAGLQMVELGTAHLTPARDRVFSLIRQPDVEPDGNLAEALHRTTRARELLAELLVRFDQVTRDRELEESLQEAITMYEVYVKDLHRFLREQTRPDADPLKRKMAVIEVDQEYLDRLREVTEMRRDLMAEFGRILADDPRLRSKYLDLIKRRRNSIRETLQELHERQAVVATELTGWQVVAENQRPDIWILAAEIRLRDTAELARAASQFEEQSTAQFPLSLDQSFGLPREVLQQVQTFAIESRTVSAMSRRMLRNPLDANLKLSHELQQVQVTLRKLDALVEELAAQHDEEEVLNYVTGRQAEIRKLQDSLQAWIQVARALDAEDFPGLVQVDQDQLAFETELLRLQMADIEDQLGVQFENGIPDEITELVVQLKQVMEAITLNQAAATYDLNQKALEPSGFQQQLALSGFEKADQLFEEIRRQTVEILDAIDPDDPNIADLEDPTLDELLERLEREPDLAALLGLPRRPRNLRTISDWVTQQQANGDSSAMAALQNSVQAARQRSEENQQGRSPREPQEDTDLDESQWQKIADAMDAQERLEEKIRELKQQAGDENLDSEQREKLLETARQLEQMQRQLASRQIDKAEWEEMARSDQMRAVMKAMATGEPIPDSQWNRVLSSLDTGLWQSERRTPPEAYRAAIEQYQERLRTLINLQ